MKEIRFIPSLAISSAMFLVACLYAASRSVWSDEGMYLSTLHQQWWHYFHSLPNYDQACPPLVSVMYSVLLESAHPSIYVLRIAILVLFSLALAYFGRQAARKFGTPLAVASVMLLVCNGVVVRYATEIKQYPFEIAVSLVLIGIYLQTMDGARSAPYLFSALGIMLSFFSFGLLLAVIPLMLERALFVEDRKIARHWMIALAAFLAIYGLLYLAIFKSLVSIQFANYPQVYKINLLRDNVASLVFWKHTLVIAGNLFAIKFLFAPCGGIILLAVARARKTFAKAACAPIRIALLLAGTILLFSGIGIYPLATTRQFLFMLPFMALTAGWAVRQLLDDGSRWSCAGVLLFVASMLLSGTVNDYRAVAGRFDFQQTRDLYEFAVNSRYQYILMDFTVQPSLEFYAADGRLNDRTILGKLVRTSMPLPQGFTVSTNYPSVFDAAGAWQALIASGQWHPLSLSRYDLYTDWLISKVPANERALLLTAAPGEMVPRISELIRRSIEQRGCSSRVLFEASGVRALSLECAH